MIGKQLQFFTISNNFIHLCQLGKLKYRSITDAGVALTHFIWSGWFKNLYTSTVAFNITQFFLSLNHYLLSLVLKKILTFFSNYLVNITNELLTGCDAWT